MRRFLFTSIFLLILFVCPAQNKIQQDTTNLPKTFIKVTLLGTGTPQPVIDRFSASILMQAGGKNLLFDVGRGCLLRLRQLKVENNTIDAVFFTHLHSDH
ncbi:MAG: MBL fold metallo-hydrolase, partial [Ginsengibacter sp.]